LRAERLNVEERYGAQGHVTASVIALHSFETSAVPMSIHDVGNSARSYRGAKRLSLSPVEGNVVLPDAACTPISSILTEARKLTP